MNKLFENALTRADQSCPPIWMMRQAGRYQPSYMLMKDTWSFEQMCKLPQIAAKVAMLPIDEFDFDVAILFSDILWHLEGLGLPMKFDPGPKFEWHLDEDNWVDYKDIGKAMTHLTFQQKAIAATREALPFKKSLVGFVGGPWTLLNYALGEDRDDISEDFKFMYLKDVIVPLLQASIRKQKEAGADAVMIFDSGLANIHKKFFDEKYLPMLKLLSEIENTAYYSRTLPYNSLNKVIDIGFAGIGVDSTVDLNKTLKKVEHGFVQGNFDETLLLQDSETILKYEIKKWLDTIEDPRGWVCGLGHGILKETPTKNVKMFVEMVRNHYS
jgi:uroporphyrinogen decarboxylase